MDVLRKSRKKYKCDSCENKIKKGERYQLTRFRLPKFGEDGETQIGIEYLSFKSCLSCVERVEKEQKEWEEFTQSEEYKYQESMWEHRYP